MEKDFDGWNSNKKQIHDHSAAPFYHKREIWWCSLGINVGFEQDGTGANYDRPVLIRDFKSEFHKLDKRLVEPLEWVSPQFKQLSPILDEIEDLVTEEFGTIRLPVNSKQDEALEAPVMKFRSLRREFFKCMHDCHKEFIGISGGGQHDSVHNGQHP